jgi:ABC-type Na+ efflux pump permease subunit
VDELKVFKVAVHELIKYSRDVKMLVGFLVLPILLILILGTTLEGELAKDIKQDYHKIFK